MSSQLYSSVDFGRKWQLIHEHVTPNRFYWWVIACFPFFCCFFGGFFMRRFYYRPRPPSKKKIKFWLTRDGGRKPLFVFCTTERAILMAENEEPLLLRLEFSTFSRRRYAVSQRLISAITFWQTACQHSLAPQHLPLECGHVKQRCHY